MTAVYGTYRDISRVASQGLFSLLLTVLPFTAIFIVGGGVMVILSRCAGKLPRNLGIAREDRSDKSQPLSDHGRLRRSASDAPERAG